VLTEVLWLLFINMLQESNGGAKEWRKFFVEVFSLFFFFSSLLFLLLLRCGMTRNKKAI